MIFYQVEAVGTFSQNLNRCQLGQIASSAKESKRKDFKVKSVALQVKSDGAEVSIIIDDLLVPVSALAKGSVQQTFTFGTQFGIIEYTFHPAGDEDCFVANFLGVGPQSSVRHYTISRQSRINEMATLCKNDKNKNRPTLITN